MYASSMYLSKRDCLRFAFMDLLQEELKQMMDLWNTHVIRSSRAETIGGIPDESYFFPEVTGIEQVQLHNYYTYLY